MSQEWEEYLSLGTDERRQVLFHFLAGMLVGEIQATMLKLCLEECGATWDEDSGRFVVRG